MSGLLLVVRVRTLSFLINWLLLVLESLKKFFVFYLKLSLECLIDLKDAI